MTLQTCPVLPPPSHGASSRTTVETVWSLPAHRIADLIRLGEVSAMEVVEAHIDRIEQVNGHLNAVVAKRYDAARDEARGIDRRRQSGDALPPLAGVPVTIKECIDVAGLASTFGLSGRRNVIAPVDDVHVARLRRSGAIILGKTNVAQMLLYVESDNPLYGRTLNPWNPARTCGGSSGGEGAIIASGGSPLGLGTDIGGSVRYPATFCGIASLKPTAGRCPDLGRFSVPVGQREVASQVGVMARTVEDVALGLAAINDDGALSGLPKPISDWRGVKLECLRIGMYTEDGLMPSSPAVKRAVAEAAQALESAGATVVPWTPPGMGEAFHLGFALATADGGELLRGMLGRDRGHPTLKTLLGLANRSSATLAILKIVLRALRQGSLADGIAPFGRRSTADYWRLVEQLMRYRDRFMAGLNQAEGGSIDAILGPASALPAFPHGATKDLGTGGVNTLLYNVLGLPAGVVPVTRVRTDEEDARPNSPDIVKRAARRCDLGSAGLPVGVQLAARPWQEHVALAAMKAIEASTPGFVFPPIPV